MSLTALSQWFRIKTSFHREFNSNKIQALARVTALYSWRRHFTLTVSLSDSCRRKNHTPLTSHFPLRSIPIMIPMRQANLCSSHVLLNSLRYTLHTGLCSSGQECGHTHVVERSLFTTHMRPLVQKTFRQGSVERMRENEF